MRELFISSLEKIVNVLAVLAAVAVVIAALVVMFGGGSNSGLLGPSGFLPGLAVLLFGALYVVLGFGAIYLALGIYDNTRRTAIATEELARR